MKKHTSPRAISPQRTATAWITTAKTGAGGKGFAFATTGDLDIYIPAALATLAQLGLGSIGKTFEVDYVELAGSRYMATALTPTAPAVETEGWDTEVLLQRLGKLEAVLEDCSKQLESCYAALGVER